jgi:hypothetical protein
MEKALIPSNSEFYTPWSGPFKIYKNIRVTSICNRFHIVCKKMRLLALKKTTNFLMLLQ